MQKAIEKADVLIEALGWIREFRDKVTVIKLGGSVMQDEDALRHVLIDIVFMESVGMHPVVVHGGGAAISQAMEAAGIEPRFVQGRRYTDDDTLRIVQQVLVGDVNRSLVERIVQYGGHAQRLCVETINVLQGERIQLEDENRRPVDLGHVGRVTAVDHDTIREVCYASQIPVIPSICLAADGQQPLNVNADTAATAVAQALKADKLVFLSDVNGVRTDKNDPDSLVHSLDEPLAQELIQSGHIATGMIPKVEACLETLKMGVGKIHIIDGRLRHSLLLEIYTNKGIGTQIVSQKTVNQK